MKISVIIPVHNGERYIAQALENILSQTYKGIEIVVVDDGSTDTTAAIAARYRGVKLVIHPEKLGVAVSRNDGIAAATGEYFHFMDVDDFINVDFYERMVDAVTVTGADMAFCGTINEMRPNSTLIYNYRWVSVDAEDKYSLTMTKDWGYSWRYLCRRKLVTDHNIAFPPGWMLEDIPFTLHAVWHAKKVVTVPGAVYHYKMRPGSALNLRDKQHTRLIEEHYRQARRFRREFLSTHGLAPRTIEMHQKYRYSILGIPMLWKRYTPGSGKVKWFLLGIPVFVKRGIRS